MAKAAQAKVRKRAALRANVKPTVAVKALDGHVSTRGRLRDVSVSGIYIYLQAKVAVGSALELVLPLPAGVADKDPIWIRCTCRVIRVEDGAPRREFGVAAMIEGYETLEKAPAGYA